MERNNGKAERLNHLNNILCTVLLGPWVSPWRADGGAGGVAGIARHERPEARPNDELGGKLWKCLLLCPFETSDQNRMNKIK